MNLSDIKTGDEIEYEHLVGRNNIAKSTGTVVQVSDKFISIQGKKYPDSILINDLKSGRAKIVGILAKKAEEVEEVRYVPPPKIELEKTFEDCQQKIDRVAKHYGCSWHIARKWLSEAGILDPTTKAAVINKEFDEAFPKPVKVITPDANNHAEREEDATPVAIKDNPHPVVVPKYLEPVIASLPPDELEKILAEELKPLEYNATIEINAPNEELMDRMAKELSVYNKPEDDFTPDDEEPIPYKMTEPILDFRGSVEDICKALVDEAEPTLDQMKCIWIEDIMDTFMKAATRLDYIAAIMGLEVGARR